MFFRPINSDCHNCCIYQIQKACCPKIIFKQLKQVYIIQALFAHRTISRHPTRNACKGERTKLRRGREGDLKDTLSWQPVNTHTLTPAQLFNDSCHPHSAGRRY